MAVEGMSCASCVGRVERAIAAVPGVETVAVNLATERAHVGFAKGVTDLKQIEDAIRQAGYKPVETAVELAIDGMNCASCVGHVEKALRAVPGVVDATVNLATEHASVKVLGGGEIVPALVKAVAAAGYEAKLLADSDAEAPARVEAAKEEEQGRLLRSVILAGLLTLPLLVAEMGSHMVPALHHWLAMTFGEGNIRIASFVLASIVQFGPGLVFLRKGWPALLRLAPDMNSLVMLGTGAAYLYSTAATFWPALLPEGTAFTYFEAGAVIVTLILLGRWFEARAKGRTSAAIRSLIALQPKAARVLRDGTESDVPVESVRPGDIVILRPGERVPVDGEVTQGSSFVDESMITGEPAPVRKEAGSLVTGGTINGSGALSFTARKVGADTVLAQIVRTVQAAQGAKLPIQALVDRVTLWFVPVVMALALATFLIWLSFGPSPALSHALVNAVAVLIIACPCAMGLATPTSIMVGTGRGAELGILFRQGDALQALRDVQVVALDKTGTLTRGKPELTDIEAASGFMEDEALRLIASAENRSEHPLALAIVAGAKARGFVLAEPAGFASDPGLGVTATVEGRSVAIGGHRLMEQIHVDAAPFADKARALAEAGKTPLYAAIDGKLAAIIAVADAVKETTPAAIAALHRLGLKVAMVTGDDRRTAEAVARTLGIDEVRAEVLPIDKAAVVKGLQQGGAKVAFVGDGINDAPALAQADVGIAIGTGTDIAIESADVVLMSGDVMGVPRAIALSQATIANIRQNLAWAFGYNALLIPVAAGVLYPAFGVLLSPVFAGLAMALSSVSVLTNALRLKRFRVPAAHEGGVK
ncbi:heavy metal translocating P-type ATPase [Bosea sp. BH3]|nr:heavy metal translocating P-type ATPase [Bosea sp. BH3]MCU4180087.1 heavy metal translocating P-type ATPase [Bosea sp. BH3]